MIDISLHAPTKQAMVADLATLGLTAHGELAAASRRHALAYLGQVAATPGVVDAAGAEVTAPAWLPGVYAILRCLDESLAVAVRQAAFTKGTTVVDRPEHAPDIAGGQALDPDLDAVKAAALAAIDAEAERRRLLVLTPGAGQALEYQHTAEEAARAVAAPDPLPAAAYPFLAAEQEALMATIGEVSLRDVAVAVLVDRAAWMAYGASIKAVRRRAKLLVRMATDAAAVATATSGIAWPETP
ncbi:MAG: hypothetical protein RDU30_06715 [Desulfovibrionaceae bacterium]|nr:hypothetical protein [Desulfovibrionaceae bacterium]